MTSHRSSSVLTGSQFDLLGTACTLFRDLRELSFDGIGITRESYGYTEQRAIELIKRVAEGFGLTTTWDAARNLFVTLPGLNGPAPFLLCGSHLDSVPEGGNYDGAAGVVAGLLCLCKMRFLRLVPDRSIKLVVLRGEESAWFGKACLGSSALLGKLTEADLHLLHRDSALPLMDAMRHIGVETETLQSGTPLIEPASIAAYLELHIEQGPVLLSKDLPVGIVSGIRGNIRHKQVLCTGEAGHSGTVPYGLRHDASLATADLLMRLELDWKERIDKGEDLVMTTGMLGTNPHYQAITRIPGEVTFSLDIRSQSNQTLASFYNVFQKECRAVAQTRGVSFQVDHKLESEPVNLSVEWIAHLESLAAKLGLSAPILASGAGHDAAIFAAAGIPSAMIFIRNDHGSHNPSEAMDMADFIHGTHLLYTALLGAA